MVSKVVGNICQVISTQRLVGLPFLLSVLSVLLCTMISSMFVSFLHVIWLNNCRMRFFFTSAVFYKINKNFYLVVLKRLHQNLSKATKIVEKQFVDFTWWQIPSCNHHIRQIKTSMTLFSKSKCHYVEVIWIDWEKWKEIWKCVSNAMGPTLKATN